MHFSRSTPAIIMAALPCILAQTFTDCDPTKKSCPPATGLPSAAYETDFTQGSGANASWSGAAYTVVDYTNEGAVFTVANANQAPTIQTDFYIFFGRIDVTMRPAPGTGIVSSIVLESDDLDEIDWEFIGGDNGKVQTNFYGKGNTTTYDRAVYHDILTPQDVWHTYSVDWTSERIEFLIDGISIRTIPYSTPQTVDGKNYPQTPMQLKLGNWAGGASENEGTVTWAGGKTDFTQGPFNMVVRDVQIKNYNPACQYRYTDLTGSWQSIEVVTSGDACNADGSPDSADASVTSAVGSATSSAQSTVTSAPSSSQSVDGIANTNVVATATVTGSAYSTNIASISALNSGLQAATSATSQMPGPSPGVNGTMSGAGYGSPSGPTATSSEVAQSTGAASLKSVMAGGSLLSAVLGLWMV